MESNIFYSLDPEKAKIILEGKMRYPSFQGFLELVDYACNVEKPSDFLIDMNKISFIDSTNLGILAKIANYTNSKNLEKPRLFCKNENIKIILNSMGFDEYFNIIEDSLNKDSTMKKLSGDYIPDSKVILDSHKTLSNMNKGNEQKFSKLINQLEKS